MKAIRIIGRSSRLSLLQMEKTKQRILNMFPDIAITLVPRISKGDALQNIPLHTVEGSDFFTQDIFDALENNEADIAVHSLKDMSSSHFFGNNIFAIIDRDDVRDIAIFSKDIEVKISAGATLIIGTCSPRREHMAIHFLKMALPQTGRFSIETRSIRGNVDSRLRKLAQGEYDGIILAVAGLNRLIESKSDAPSIEQLLHDKKRMVLPLIECVPAPCQGAIVAEAHPSNKLAVEILSSINSSLLMEDCIQEKKTASNFGTGCLQQFGVTTLHYADNKKVLYAAGTNSNGQIFEEWKALPEVIVGNKKLFSAAEYMGQFFNYQYTETLIPFSEPAAYVGNYKSIHTADMQQLLYQKKIWAAGTKTWLELSKKGYWVEGCADAMGLESLIALWKRPLFQLQQNDIRIITHVQAASNWQKKGWKTIASYQLTEKPTAEISVRLSEADAIFWTSIQQYHLYKKIIKKDIQHICPSGETAELLKEEGLNPVVFPNIKAFAQWKKSYIPQRSEG